MQAKIAIVGAGISGLACALHLAQRGFEIDIWEHRLAKELISSSGRDMSMDLSARGIYALKKIGIFDDIEKNSVVMTHKIFHAQDGTLTRLAYGPSDKHYILAVSRDYLFQRLLKAAQKIDHINLNFGYAFESINFTKPELIIRDLNTQERIISHPKIIIGADGINSKSRAEFEKHIGLCFSSTPLKQNYKELTISKEFGEALEPHAMHLWSRGQIMFLAQPNLDRSFTCTLLMPLEGEHFSFASIKSKTHIEELFNNLFRDAKILMPSLSKEYEEHKTGSLRILQGQSFTCESNFLLIGDAAHGMVPFFGQGVNCCLEDCTVLDQCLDEAHDHWPTALQIFDRRRVSNCNAISSMSYNNYPELIEHNILEHVLLKKQIELSITKEFAHSYISYHNLVCFHRVPYSYALACKKLQEPMLDRLAGRIKHINELDWVHVKHEVISYEKQLSMLKEF